MPQSTNSLNLSPSSSAEKLSLLSALLGPAAVARIRKEKKNQPNQVSSDPRSTSQVDWHGNQLIKNIRQSASSAKLKTDSSRHRPDKHEGRKDEKTKLAYACSNKSVDARLAMLVSEENLSLEHPATIARVLSSMPQMQRVVTLKSLPGPLARTVLNRLRK